MDFSTYSNSNLICRKVPFYNDEPKIYQYVADLRDITPGGASVRGCGSDPSRHVAARKAIGEAIERACLLDVNSLPTVQSLASDKSHAFVNPRRFQHFSAEQLDLESFQRMRISEGAVFRWTPAVNALTGEDVWLPSQLVFCPYDLTSEPVIRFPSSNGSASGTSMDEARCRATLEVFERDAFMCWYLAAAPARSIGADVLAQNEDTKKISAMYERYKLDLRILALPSCWSFPVILAIIIDETGVGPGLQIGLKCHPHLPTAIKGAVSEAQQMRPWLRDHMQLYGLPQCLKRVDIVDSWSRALFWAAPEQHRSISHLWSPSRINKYEENGSNSLAAEDVDWKTTWKLILSDIRNSGASLLLTDLTGSVGRSFGVSVVKALVPQAHSLYMDERYPYLRSKNLTLALKSFGPRWSFEEKDDWSLGFPPHPFS